MRSNNLCCCLCRIRGHHRICETDGDHGANTVQESGKDADQGDWHARGSTVCWP